MTTPLNVAILAYPNLCLFEFSCAFEVFGQTRPEFEREHYRVSVVPIDEPIVAIGMAKLRMQCDQQTIELQDADLIIVPGWQGLDVEPSKELVNQLRLSYDRGARIASICSGAFLLAYAGLLEQKFATTHWRYIDMARAKFPNVKFDSAVLYAESERIITSAGSAAGLDMCLHIVAEDYGQAVANAYARRLVIPPFRDGGQAQFIQQPMPARASKRFANLLSDLEADLSAPHSVQSMAAMVNLSERHFLRLFKDQFSTTPAKWLTRVRLQHACRLLEGTDWPVKKIAQQSGLGSEESMRHHFRQTLLTSPQEYRAAFVGCNSASKF